MKMEEYAMSSIDAMRQDRDRWVEIADEKSLEVKGLRLELGRAWADRDAARREVERLQWQVEALSAEPDGRPAMDGTVGAPLLEASWSGLREGE